MADEEDVRIPVRFNPFKHHRNYILSILDGAAPEDILGLLDPVCNNYIDIYTGMMTPGAIVNDVVNILKSNHVFLLTDFMCWMVSKNGYQQIKLGTSQNGLSGWVMTMNAIFTFIQPGQVH